MKIFNVIVGIMAFVAVGGVMFIMFAGGDKVTKSYVKKEFQNVKTQFDDQNIIIEKIVEKGEDNFKLNTKTFKKVNEIIEVVNLNSKDLQTLKQQNSDIKTDTENILYQVSTP